MDKRFQGKTCPFCKTPFKEDDVIVVCSVCEMPHHLSCWQENNGCTTFGCTGTIKETVGSVQPNSAPLTAHQSVTQTLTQNLETKPEQPTRRFETLFESEPNTIQCNIPILVEKLSLIIDHQDDSLMARCIFRSLTEKPIMALLVDVVCTDVWGKQAESVDGFQFLDLKTKRDSTFGQTKPIPIPDSATRAIEVVIKKVLYNDRTMVDASPDVSVLPKQDTLETFLGTAELAKEYARELNERAKYTTVEGDHYWRCACGAINSNEESKCYRCNAEKAQLISLLNVELISSNLEAYKEEKRLKEEREQAEREEQLRQAEERMRLAQEEKERKEKEAAEALRLEKERRKKKTKKIVFSVLGVLLLAFLVYATIWHAIPYYKYTKASNALEAGAYDEAYSGFAALGDFSDSQYRAIDTLYQKGCALMDSESYAEAATVFEGISDYLNSAELVPFCQQSAAYLEARALYDAGQYREASEAFAALSDFSDSATCVKMCDYAFATQLLESAEYEKAHDTFVALGDYSDSADLANESYYRLAGKLFDEGKFEEAHNYYKELSSKKTNYKDSADKDKESQYCLGKQLYDNEQYHEAYVWLNGISSYKDSKDVAHEAEYRYAVMCFDEKDYENAYKAFNAIATYQDASDRLPEAKYYYAVALSDASDWKNAYPLFKSLGNFKDSTTRYQQTYYSYGLQLLDSHSYKEAVTVFSDLGWYQQSTTKLNEAKYGYVLAHKNSTDTTTYNYLKDLKAAWYKDSADIYKSLYAWTAKIVINDTEKGTTAKNSISKYNTVYSHVTLSGGPPTFEGVKLGYSYTWPGGGGRYGSWDWTWYEGSSGWFSTWLTTPAYGYAGTFYCSVYIVGTGETIGSATVSITN